MLIRFAKNNSAKQGLLLFLLSLCLWSKFLMETGFGEFRVYALWMLVLMESVFVSYILSKHKLSKNSLFVALVYMTARTVLGFTAGAPDADAFYLSAATVVPLLCLLAGYYFLKMYEAEFSLPALLNGTVLWATAVLLHPAFIYTIPCVFLILLVYAANRGRIWGVATLGLALPFMGVGIWDFLNGTTWLTEGFARVPALGFRLPFSPDKLPFYFMLSLSFRPRSVGITSSRIPSRGRFWNASVPEPWPPYSSTFSCFSARYLPIQPSRRFHCCCQPPTCSATISPEKETLLSEGLFLVFIILGVLSVWL